MKIAVAYENGQIFQHFGRCAQYKIYEVKDGAVTESYIIDSEASGHEEQAAALDANDVSMVICGGIGEGAESALSDAGIVICSGITGDADEAVASFLRGELTSAGVNCDHHHGEEDGEGCGCGCGGSCGSSGGCGGGCGGCGGGAPQILFEGPNAGKTVRVHYKGTLNDGTQFDSSYDRGETLDFVCGIGRMIRGFDAAVVNMTVGEVVDIHLMPEEAYGMPDPNAILTVNIEELPGAEDVNPGDRVYLSNAYGQPVPATVTAKDEKTITFDANHEMAGKELNFRIELVEVMD